MILDDLLNDSERQKVFEQKKVVSEKYLFTIGYEGKSLETYINQLIINDVKVLCDVRKNPLSKK